MLSIPVTRTSVSVETATTSCTIPETHVSVAASRIVLRRTTRGSGIEQVKQPRTERRRAAVGGVTDVAAAERGVREPADGDDAAAARERVEEGARGGDLR